MALKIKVKTRSSKIRTKVILKNTVTGAAAAPPSAIVYNFPPPSGADLVHRTGDELDIWQTIFNNGILPNVGTRALPDPNDFTKLLTLNAFGTLEKFTNDKGLLTYDGSGGETVDYVINHNNGIAYLTLTQEFISGGNANTNWDNHIDGALAWVQGVYSDFFLPSFDQLSDIADRGSAGRAFDYPPFNTTDGTQIWMSSTAIVSNNEAYRTDRNSGIGDDLKTASNKTAYYCRKHF